MLQIERKNLRNARKKGEPRMSDASAAMEAMQRAFPEKRYGSVKAAIGACYDQMTRHYVKRYEGFKRWTLRRAETIWQGIACRIDAFEMDALREAEARQEAYAQATQLYSTAAYLRQTDEDFHSETIAALECAAAEAGVLDCALAEPEGEV